MPNELTGMGLSQGLAITGKRERAPQRAKQMAREKLQHGSTNPSKLATNCSLEKCFKAHPMLCGMQRQKQEVSMACPSF